MNPLEIIYLATACVLVLTCLLLIYYRDEVLHFLVLYFGFFLLANQIALNLPTCLFKTLYIRFLKDFLINWATKFLKMRDGTNQKLKYNSYFALAYTVVAG